MSSSSGVSHHKKLRKYYDNVTDNNTMSLARQKYLIPFGEHFVLIKSIRKHLRIQGYEHGTET